MLIGAMGEPDEVAGTRWVPAAFAVLVCFFLLGGAVLGFADLILASGRAEAYFMFPATCH